MTVLIVYNSIKTNKSDIVEKAVNIFENAGAKTITLNFDEFLTVGFNGLDTSKIGAVAVIGGDGTIIKVAKTCAELGIPVIGINAGRLGYLAGVEEQNIELLGNIVSGNYALEKRMMLKAEIYSENKLIKAFNCLNDFVISKSSVANLLDIELTVNNDELKYRADGLIAATPTGSTAYSLSAGGPVVDPLIDCIILTAVCPHTLMNRSLVVGENTDLSLRVFNTDGQDIVLSADGRAELRLDETLTVKIKKSPVYADFIKFNNYSVYKIFSEKTKLD